jgi:zinc transport system permease protein
MMATMFHWLGQLDFVTKALIVGLGVTLLSGPLGSILTWRKMAYFGDTLAHSTLLGLSLALLLNINIYLGLILTSMLVAIMLSLTTKNKLVANDTVLGILSHTSLSGGLILATSSSKVRINLLAYLYGDLLAVNAVDIVIIVILVLSILPVLYKYWNQIIAATISPEIAQCENVKVERIRWLIIMLLAVLFAMAIKIVGVLLINALLIIPAATARLLSKSPEEMAVKTSLLGAGSLIAGILLSTKVDIPTGPAIVMCAAAMFFMVLVLRRKAPR